MHDNMIVAHLLAKWQGEVGYGATQTSAHRANRYQHHPIRCTAADKTKSLRR